MTVSESPNWRATKKDPAASADGVFSIPMIQTARLVPRQQSASALTGFEPALGLVDHVYTALAAHNAAVAVALLERAE
jgi:hypothetical protein